jgi:Zn-dependent protease
MLLLASLQYFTLAPAAVIALLLAFAASMLVGLSFHEFSHAAVADRLGDHTARRFGRLTLDPRAHIDPMGALMVLLVGFGWARPTPVNPNATANPRLSMVLIALGGPVSNLLLAFAAGLPLRFGLLEYTRELQMGFDPVYLAGFALSWFIYINVLLAVFNLLPLAPLDGFKVVLGLLPPDLSRQVEPLERWGPGLLMLLFFLPFLTGGAFNPLFEVMDPLRRLILGAVVGEPSAFVG